MDAEIVKRMKEVEKAVLGLDESIRGEAFQMMRGYILTGGAAGGTEGEPPSDSRAGSDVAAPKGESAFMKKHESDKDHENVLAIAAWWYSQYGNSWFEPNKDLRAIADRTGLTVPVRMDMTVRQLKRDDKPVFRKSGARYAPTPKGERFLRKQFGVTKGSQTPPTDES